MSKSEACLIHTDADLPVVASVFVLINETDEFVVEYRFEHDKAPKHSFLKKAIVDDEDTRSMAAHFRVEVEDLPALFDERCGLAYDSTASEAERIFQESLELILEAGVRFRLRDIAL